MSKLVYCLKLSGQNKVCEYQAKYDLSTVQVKMATIQKYYQYVLEKGIFTDCTFIVGPEVGKTREFQAHRVHIARVSPVFAAMFTRKEMEEARTGHVRITDISPNTFHLLLNYVYGKEPETVSFKEAQDLAFAADKYQVKALLEYCVTQMSPLITSENIWIAFETANLLENDQILQEACIQVLQCDTLRCIAHPGFLPASEDHVALLLEQDELNVDDEQLLVNAIVRWARHAARQRGLSDDDSGIRAVLEPRLLKLFRLLAMSSQQFLLGPGLAGWLTENEKTAIEEGLQSGDFSKLPPQLSCVAQKRRIVTGTTNAVLQIQGQKPLTNAVLQVQGQNPSTNAVQQIQGQNPSGSFICKREITTRGSQINVQQATNSCCCEDKSTRRVMSYHKCVHATLVFRVNSNCEWLGFQCASRYMIDPTTDSTSLLRPITQNPLYQDYQECIVSQTYTFNHSLSTLFPKLSIGTLKKYYQKTEYNSTISVMFNRPIPLVTDNWFAVEVVFRHRCKDRVELGSDVPVILYPNPSRANKVCTSSGIEFIFRTEQQAGYYTSQNDGIIESLIFSA